MPSTPQSKANKRARIIYTAECYRRGMGNAAIVNHLKEHYDVSETTARNYIKGALEWLASYDDCDFIKEVRAKQVARAELLLENAIAEQRWDTANRIIDTLNKTLGLYETKQKVEITSNEIQFKFGGVTDDSVELDDTNSEETESEQD